MPGVTEGLITESQAERGSYLAQEDCAHLHVLKMHMGVESLAGLRQRLEDSDGSRGYQAQPSI